MKLAPLPAIAAGLLLASIAFQGAQAQAPANPVKMVTRDELRVCMNSETDVTARRQAATARIQPNGDEAAAIRVEARELAEEHKRLVEDQKPTDRFNRKLRTHNERVRASQAVGEAVRAELEAVNKALVAYNDQCGGISFMPQDKEAILKEREAARK